MSDGKTTRRATAKTGARRSTKRSAARPRKPSRARRNVRDEIYRAALACFQRDGIRATLMEDVARKAGVSRPAVYYYFPDKDALVLEVIVRQVREIHRRIREKVRRASGMKAILEVAVHTVRIARTDPFVRLLTRPDTAGLTARVVESDVVLGLRRELWVPLLEAAREQGELRTDRDLDDLIRWITFVEFSMVTGGDAFDFATESAVREQLEAYLAPALAPRGRT